MDSWRAMMKEHQAESARKDEESARRHEESARRHEESIRRYEEMIDLLKKYAISIGHAKVVEEWEKWRDLKRVQEASEDVTSKATSQVFVPKDCANGSKPEEQHLVVACSDEAIVKFPTQLATIEKCGADVRLGSDSEAVGKKLEKDGTDSLGVQLNQRSPNRKVKARLFWKKFVVACCRTRKPRKLGTSLNGLERSDSHKELQVCTRKLKPTYQDDRVSLKHTNRIQRRTWDPGITAGDFFKTTP